jgi:hypothetical protein
LNFETAPFPLNTIHCLLQKPFSAVKVEMSFAVKAPNCFNYGARFMVVIPLLSYYKTIVTTARLSLAYKSQRKTMNKRGDGIERGERKIGRIEERGRA